MEPTQLEKDQQRLAQQERALRKNMNKQRINQLKMANEEEDKTIRKLEKLLRIDKTKSVKSVPKMFHDGLDYALEMCLPDNISKMYTAAKEAADAEDKSDSEWQEDFISATGQNIETNEKKPEPKTDKINKKAMARLKKVESKYFSESDDALDSDMSDVDSEFEVENGESNDDDAPEEMSSKSKKPTKVKINKKKPIEEDFSDEDSDMDMEGDGLDDLLNEEESNDEMDVENDSDQSDGENNDIDEAASSDENNSEHSDDDFSDATEQIKKPDTWEDIYGRKRDKEGNVITETNNTENKYIPPHMRARLAAENLGDMDSDPVRKEKLLRLKRILKGNLNRLSEANMHKIFTDIENLYMQNSSHDMSTTLTSLIFDAIITKTLAPERLVMEHMMLIAALHANVGSEVGTHVLEVLVERFNKIINENIETQEVEDKSLDNIVFMLCHMYTFKVIATFLI